MPRPLRVFADDTCYHVLSRGNCRSRVFHDDQDYAHFLYLMGEACRRIPMRMLAYCLMPNHFHFVLWPRKGWQVSSWMHWLLTTHVSRHHRRHETTGHAWQSRFKAFPVQDDHYLLTVLRYVERNALRANLVERAESWRWSSLTLPRSKPWLPWLVEGPVERPPDWLTFVNEPQTEAELEALRRSVRNGEGLGTEAWKVRLARQLGVGGERRPGGRPKRAHESRPSNAPVHPG